jgi:hypothetical protein
MTAMSAALLQAYQANLGRYCQLLLTDLINDERCDLHRRVEETQCAIDRLEASDDLSLSREALPQIGVGEFASAGMESRAHL